MAQNAHFGGIALRGFRASKSFMHPAVVADADRGAKGVFDLVHRGKMLCFREGASTEAKDCANQSRLKWSKPLPVRAFGICYVALVLLNPRRTNMQGF